MTRGRRQTRGTGPDPMAFVGHDHGPRLGDLLGEPCIVATLTVALMVPGREATWAN
jgi:hypothetical protein